MRHAPINPVGLNMDRAQQQPSLAALNAKYEYRALMSFVVCLFVCPPLHMPTRPKGHKPTSCKPKPKAPIPKTRTPKPNTQNPQTQTHEPQTRTHTPNHVVWGLRDGIRVLGLGVYFLFRGEVRVWDLGFRVFWFGGPFPHVLVWSSLWFGLLFGLPLVFP